MGDLLCHRPHKVVLKFGADAEFYTLTFAARMPMCRFCRIQYCPFCSCSVHRGEGSVVTLSITMASSGAASVGSPRPKPPQKNAERSILAFFPITYPVKSRIFG